MFNDLNNPNSAPRPVVDDIFAETDKPGASNAQSDIETHRVGLATGGENLPHASVEMMTGKHNNLKLIIIVLAALVVLGGGYFAYTQFFKAKQVDQSLNTVATTTKTKATTTNPVTNTDANFVNVIPGASSTSETINPIESATSTVIASSTADGSMIDSDSDGLTDQEESKLGTNPNMVDTDGDGLSDYEEVKIYHTSPLIADTDGDGFSDGVEVKSGHNPNGPGLLPGNTPTK